LFFHPCLQVGYKFFHPQTRMLQHHFQTFALGVLSSNHLKGHEHQDSLWYSKCSHKFPSPLSSSCYFHSHSPLVMNLTNIRGSNFTSSWCSTFQRLTTTCNSITLAFILKILAYLNVDENLTMTDILIPKRKNKTMQHPKWILRCT
jgi:hypothetical protein